MASSGRTVLIVVAPFYKDIADALLEGAHKHLDENGVTYKTVFVSGALEIPQVIGRVCKRSPEKYDGYLALGCVIRGETTHYDIVSGESARALMDLAIMHDVMIGNGILACENGEQAYVRADPAQKDKGGEAARALISLWNVEF